MVEMREQKDHVQDGIAEAIRHRLAEKEREDAKNRNWAEVREASRAEIVREEEAKREAVRKLTIAQFGVEYSNAPFVSRTLWIGISPIRQVAWVITGLGAVFGVTALTMLIGEASKLATTDDAVDLVKLCVPLILTTGMAVLSFELGEVYRKAAKKKMAEGDERAWLVGAALYVALGIVLVGVVVYRWQNGISWMGE